MKNEMTKKATVSALNVMVEHADKGPSGFWTEDQEGCGNPQIFPEFEKGLKESSLVQKEHYLCPWNTAVQYGSDQGKKDLFSSCYGEKPRYVPMMVQ